MNTDGIRKMSKKQYTWHEALDYVHERCDGLINLKCKHYTQTELEKIVRQFDEIDKKESEGHEK